MKPDASLSEFIEYAGRWWETLSSGSRTAGRILGWLMICDPPHQASAELAEALQSSAGSISTQSRLLESIGLVERTSFPGDRQTYYQLKPHVWTEVMKAELPRLAMMKDLADRAAEFKPQERTDRVTGLTTVARFLIDEWPELMDRLAKYVETENQID